MGLLKQDLAANGPKEMRVRGEVYRWVWTTLFSSGFQLCLLYRVYSSLYRSAAPLKLLSRFLFNFSGAYFGCHIHPEARIGGGLCLPHPTGIVIGGAQIDEHVTLYQHVTIGLSHAEAAVYPRVMKDAVVYAGAVIVGGVRVGAAATVGANSVVTADVPDGATAVGVPARVLESRGTPKAG